MLLRSSPAPKGRPHWRWPSRAVTPPSLLRSSPAPKGRRHSKLGLSPAKSGIVAILASPEGPAPPVGGGRAHPAGGVAILASPEGPAPPIAGVTSVVSSKWLRSSPAPKGRRHHTPC